MRVRRCVGCPPLITSAWRSTSAPLAFLFFIAGGVLALIMRTQLAADGGVVSQQVYDELFTMHGSTMVYLFVVPRARGGPVPGPPAGRCGRDRRSAGGARRTVAADSGGVTMWSGFSPRGARRRRHGGGSTRSPVFRTRRERHGPVDLRRDLGDGRGDAVGGLRARDRFVAPRARDDADAHARLHVDDGGDVPDGPVRVPGAAGGARPPVGSAPRRRRACRQRRRRRLPGAVLVLRAPRGVRHVLPLRRNGRGDPRHVLAPALLRLSGLRRGAACVRASR